MGSISIIWKRTEIHRSNPTLRPGNRFEALKGDRKGQCSIRINDQVADLLRMASRETTGPLNVEIVDYH